MPDKSLARHRQRCSQHDYSLHQCQEHLSSNYKELLQAKIRPVQLFHSIRWVADDLCYHAGRSYVVWVDYYLGWPIHCSHTAANLLIAVFIETFSQMAVQDALWTVRVSQFTSQSLLYHWGILPKKSTLYYHIPKAVRRHRQLQRLWKHTQSSVDRMILE